MTYRISVVLPRVSVEPGIAWASDLRPKRERQSARCSRGLAFRLSSDLAGKTVVVKLLLVEDDKRLAVSLRKGLVAEGHSVEIANDGEQGLWMAQSEPFDAIVLDIMLPKIERISGVRVASEFGRVDADSDVNGEGRRA